MLKRALTALRSPTPHPRPINSRQYLQTQRTRPNLKNALLCPKENAFLTKKVVKILDSDDAPELIRMWLAEPHRKRFVRALQGTAAEIFCDKRIHTAFVHLVEQLNQNEKLQTLQTCLSLFDQLGNNYYAVCKMIILLENMENDEDSLQDVLNLYSEYPITALNSPSAMLLMFLMHKNVRLPTNLTEYLMNNVQVLLCRFEGQVLHRHFVAQLSEEELDRYAGKIATQIVPLCRYKAFPSILKDIINSVSKRSLYFLLKEIGDNSKWLLDFENGYAVFKLGFMNADSSLQSQILFSLNIIFPSIIEYYWTHDFVLFLLENMTEPNVYLESIKKKIINLYFSRVAFYANGAKCICKILPSSSGEEITMVTRTMVRNMKLHLESNGGHLVVFHALENFPQPKKQTIVDELLRSDSFLKGNKWEITILCSVVKSAGDCVSPNMAIDYIVGTIKTETHTMDFIRLIFETLIPVLPKSSFTRLLTFLDGIYFKLAKIDKIDFIKQLYQIVPKKLYLNVVKELAEKKLHMALETHTAKLSAFFSGVQDEEIRAVWDKKM